MNLYRAATVKVIIVNYITHKHFDFLLTLKLRYFDIFIFVPVDYAVVCSGCSYAGSTFLGGFAIVKVTVVNLLHTLKGYVFLGIRNLVNQNCVVDYKGFVVVIDEYNKIITIFYKKSSNTASLLK